MLLFGNNSALCQATLHHHVVDNFSIIAHLRVFISCFLELGILLEHFKSRLVICITEFEHDVHLIRAIIATKGRLYSI